MAESEKAESDGYMPMMTCPACKHNWQWDDYYDVREGSNRECPYCEALVVVKSAEHLLFCILTTPEKSNATD